MEGATIYLPTLYTFKGPNENDDVSFKPCMFFTTNDPFCRASLSHSEDTKIGS